MNHKKNDISDEDAELFQQAMETGNDGFLDDNLSETNSQSDQFILSDYAEIPAVLPNEVINYQTTGLQDKLVRRLRQGKFELNSTIDLHQLTLDESLPIIENFIHDCQLSAERFGLIIHGRGKSAILKSFVNYFLRKNKNILAFCSAKQQDGGTGATYILIKQRVKIKK